MSPSLINIALESVIRKVLSKVELISLSDNQKPAIVTYADDLVIIIENEESLKESKKALIRTGKEILT